MNFMETYSGKNRPHIIFRAAVSGQLSRQCQNAFPRGQTHVRKKCNKLKHLLAAEGKTKRPEALRFRVFLARREGFEPPAFWSVGCLKHKSEPKRLRFVLFTAVHSVDFPLFPPSPACSGSVLGQKWVKISSQAVFKAGMSSTKVSHTEGMSIEPYHKVREKKKIFVKPRTMWYDL